MSAYMINLLTAPSPTFPKTKVKPCAYPDCAYHKAGAKDYCCVGCACDHEDSDYPMDVTVKLDAYNKGIALIWFLRKSYSDDYREQRVWFSLLTSAYVGTGPDAGDRYLVEDEYGNPFSDMDGKPVVLDTHSSSPYGVGCKYAVVAVCYTKAHAVKIAKALNR